MGRILLPYKNVLTILTVATKAQLMAWGKVNDLAPGQKLCLDLHCKGGHQRQWNEPGSDRCAYAPS